MTPAMPILTAQCHEWSVEVYPQLSKLKPFYAMVRRVVGKRTEGFNVEASSAEQAIKDGIDAAQARGFA